MKILVDSIEQNTTYIYIFCFLLLFILTVILQSQFVYRTIIIQKIENVVKKDIPQITETPMEESETPMNIDFGLCPDKKTPKLDPLGTNCEKISFNVEQEEISKYFVSTKSMLIFSAVLVVILLNRTS